MAARGVRCVVCGDALNFDDQVVLARGRRRLPHCSDVCLRETVARQRIARTVRRRRTALSVSVLALVLAGAWTVRRHRAPPPHSISYAWPETAWEKSPAPQPLYYGPAWPPTDDDWMFAFERASWVYPLPGPARRAPAPDERLFGSGSAHFCRKPHVCGVALGGQLWGEHVYAVQDGIVERTQANAGGGVTVRIAHFGGMVFTQYFHLAAIPRGVSRGAHVAAGDVIGLVGDTGIAGEASARPHLHFAFSIRPSPDWSEAYWDPTPLMAKWRLRVPPHGTVAGLTAAIDDEDLLRRRRGR
jgi:murein DD-endopeptidase MepM/ murein hydrolase activator NlpD